MKILAIETSCDETAAAILEIKNGQFNLLSNIVSSQVKIHAKYGGIVPEVAARKQMEAIIPVAEEAINMAKETRLIASLKNIDYFAVTQGPGLITSLMVGVETAKTLAMAFNKPLIMVNHLAGHITSALLKSEQRNFQPRTFGTISNFQKLEKIIFPALALVVSGGHTMLVLMKKYNHYQIIGQTLDDAVGEAFDKAAQILNLGYPGGPIISRLAEAGDAKKFNLPRPMIHQNNFNFSFAGLKTALLYLLPKLKNKGQQFSEQTVKDLCACFQAAAVDVLVEKTLRAMKFYSVKTFLLGGGVAANQLLRASLTEKISQQFPDVKILIPEMKFTGDNAAMIALSAYFKINKLESRIKSRMTSGVDYKKLKADPNMRLGSK